MTRASPRRLPNLAMALSQTKSNPRPVAEWRPCDPPISTGFPVTTAVVVRRACME